MKSTTIRALIAFAGFVVLFEFACQISASWKESSEEMLHLLLLVGMIGALVWATRPVARRIGHPFARAVLVSTAVVILLVGNHSAIYFYSWHVRPNIGLYEEPDWVARHPEFQKQLRARIQANKW